MIQTNSITERGSDWDKHDRAWANYNAKRASPDYKPPVFARDAEWERVGEGLDRVKVPGGWLYRTTRHIAGGLFGGGGSSVALAFVPYPSTPEQN